MMIYICACKTVIGTTTIENFRDYYIIGKQKVQQISNAYISIIIFKCVTKCRILWKLCQTKSVVNACMSIILKIWYFTYDCRFHWSVKHM
jgi:hypothetical protein